MDYMNELVSFTKNFSGDDETKYDLDTCIERDIGITGDDAVEYIIEFRERFNVTVSRFMAADYFSAEGYDITEPIIRFVIQKKRTRKILQLKHLVKAMQCGVLDEDVINSVGVMTEETWS